ncbi:hypothetical protein [Polaromonas jejuensis]|uniref:Uncharacterized protein n=1 Tax=Polaromonas jejuensis TaxID=457502 RepID=A0ABW0QF17_9BURK|nr:hypothetical protein [Polaromonas jejuensis]
MAHVLAKLTGVKLADVKQQLEKDAADHAEQGMVLEHLWQNAEAPGEVLFLFQVDDLDHCRQRIRKVHAQARQDNPDMPLPDMTFLEGA